MHSIRKLWIREVKKGPVLERESLDLVAGRGVTGDHKFDGRRHVTIVFEDDWAAALADLGQEVDPKARRANVLVSGGGGTAYLGRRLRLGGAELEIKGIVSPCSRMDEACDGLQTALEPDGRAGIWGQVLTGATVRPGDSLEEERT